MAPFRWTQILSLLVVLAALVAFPGHAAAQDGPPQGIGPRPPTDTGIVVNLPARTLYWYVDGELVRAFPVAIGKQATQTILGSYAVENMAIDPWWLPPDGGQIVPPGPSNPLGTRWIGFRGGYGIHGNNNPSSIGQVVSLGCVRMFKEDVEWLYRQVSVGTPVHILYETVQVQYGAEGRQYLAVYPDVYGRGMDSAADVLKAAGLEPDAVAVSGPGLYRIDTQVLVNGHAVEAVLHQGEPYVRARTLGERLSATVGWDPETKEIALDGQILPSLILGDVGYVKAASAAALLGVEFSWNQETHVARLSGQPLFLNGHLWNRQAHTLDGLAYLPVRQVGEALGAEVGWDGEMGHALLDQQPVDTWLRSATAYASAAALAGRLGLRVDRRGDAVYLWQ